METQKLDFDISYLSTQFNQLLIEPNLQETDVEFIGETSEENKLLYSTRSTTTAFVTNYLLQGISLERLLKTVIETFDKMVKSYIQYYNKNHGVHIDESQIIFFYKGGNSYRAITLEFEKLTGKSLSTPENEYAELYSRSDNDFQINIDPSIDDYNKVYSDMKIISFNLLRQLKRHFIERKEFFFPNLSKPESQEAFIKLINNINTTDKKWRKMNENSGVKPYNHYNILCNKWYKTKNMGNFELVEGFNGRLLQHFLGQKCANRKDFKIAKKSIGQGITFMMDNQTNTDIFYVTMNDTIEFGSGEYNVKFQLVRMKISMVSIYESEGKYGAVYLPGELIDISIPHASSVDITDYQKKLIHYRELLQSNKRVYPPIKDYRLTVQDTDTQSSITINFKSYSCAYLEHDYEKMIFRDNLFPWRDWRGKFSKRYKRYIILLFIRLVSVYPIKYVQNYLYTIATRFSKIPDPFTIEDIDTYNINSNEPQECSTFHLYHNLIISKKTQMNELDIMLYQEYLTTIGEACANLYSYLDKSGKSPNEKLLDIDIDGLYDLHQLGGKNLHKNI